MDLQFRGAYSEWGAYMPVYTVCRWSVRHTNFVRAGQRPSTGGDLICKGVLYQRGFLYASTYGKASAIGDGKCIVESVREKNLRVGTGNCFITVVAKDRERFY